MSGGPLDRLLREELARRQRAGGLRQRRATRVVDAAHVEIEGRRFTQFGSNNYLGLTHHPRVFAAAADTLRRCGVGSGASGLITGYSQEHEAAEKAIAAWKRAEAAVLLPSGYQTAHAVIQTLTGGCLAGPGQVRFLMDKLCHACLIDAIAGSGAPYRVFPHNHLAKLERLLSGGETDKQAREQGDTESGAEQVQVVVTESIFSMDGDSADLAGIAKLKQRYPFVLLLDEAHGSGVYGPAGAGYAAECGLQDAVDISIVTLSKAVGVSGGAVCASRAFCDAVVNWGRAYIYSTQTPPAIAAAAMAAIAVMRQEPQRQQRVRALARRARSELARRGVRLLDAARGSCPPQDSPIIPVILGGQEQALRAAEMLRENGLLVPAIRPPTVARGSSRLRITLSCEHSDEEIGTLIEELARLGTG